MVNKGVKRESTVPVAVRPFVKIIVELSVCGEGLISRGEKCIPPQGLHFELFKFAHEGHLGQTLTKRRLRENYWCPGMDQNVTDWMK